MLSQETSNDMIESVKTLELKELVVFVSVLNNKNLLVHP